MARKEKLMLCLAVWVALTVILPSGVGFALTASLLHIGILPFEPWSFGWVFHLIVIWLVGSFLTFVGCVTLAWRTGTQVHALVKRDWEIEHAAEAAEAEY